MPDFVRVEDSRTGAQITVVRDGIEKPFHTPLLEDDGTPSPAVDYAGNPLPPVAGHGDATDSETDVEGGEVGEQPVRFVRVRDKATGAHITVSVDGVEDTHEVLEGHDAVDDAGMPLPPKPMVSVAGLVLDADTSDDQGPAWADQTVPKLKAEIDARNELRDDEADQIVVADPGNKPELVAALVADDDAQV